MCPINLFTHRVFPTTSPSTAIRHQIKDVVGDVVNIAAEQNGSHFPKYLYTGEAKFGLVSSIVAGEPSIQPKKYHAAASGPGTTEHTAVEAEEEARLKAEEEARIKAEAEAAAAEEARLKGEEEARLKAEEEARLKAEAEAAAAEEVRLKGEEEARVKPKEEARLKAEAEAAAAEEARLMTE